MNRCWRFDALTDRPCVLPATQKAAAANSSREHVVPRPAPLHVIQLTTIRGANCAR